MGLNDSMALGAYNVIKDKPAYDNVYVARGRRSERGLALIKQGGCESRYISTGLNSPSLAAEDALKIAIDVATALRSRATTPRNPSRRPSGSAVTTSMSTTTRTAFSSHLSWSELPDVAYSQTPAITDALSLS